MVRRSKKKVEVEQAVAADLNVTEVNSGAVKTAVEAIQTAVELIDNMISGSEGQVDVVTSALPSGAATEATLTAVKTAVEVIDNFVSVNRGLVTEDNSAAVLTAAQAIQTAVEVIDNFISGTKGLVTEDNSAAIKTAVEAVQTAVETIDNFVSGSRGLVTEDNSVNILSRLTDIKTAVEILDNVVSGSEAQVDVVAELPAGTQNIGDVDVASLPETGTVTYISKTATGDIVTPTSGKALKVHKFFFYSSADITVELRFKTSGNVIGGLTVKGACGMNLLGSKLPQGAADEIIEIYLSAAGTVKGFVTTTEV